MKKKKEEEEIEKQGSHVQYSYDSQVQCAKKKVEWRKWRGTNILLTVNYHPFTMIFTKFYNAYFALTKKNLPVEDKGKL